MTGWVVGLVLLSALMHAGWNFLVKKGDDSQLDTALFSVGCSLIAAVLLGSTAVGVAHRSKCPVVIVH